MRTGCLDGKTQQQKDDFFFSLSKFAITDVTFFEEQYWDLLPEERKQFSTWVINHNHNMLVTQNCVNLIEELLTKTHIS